MEQKVASSKTPAKKGKSKVIASKRNMNFARHESSLNMKKLAIILLIVLIVGGVFAKFAILDQIAKKTDAYTRLAQEQDRLNAINVRMSKYNELKAEYDRYSFGRMDEDEVSTVARTDLMDIVEKVILPKAAVSMIEASGNTAEVVVHNISLEDASELVIALEEEELVSDALVSFAESEESNPTEIHMTIYLRKVVE